MVGLTILACWPLPQRPLFGRDMCKWPYITVTVANPLLDLQATSGDCRSLALYKCYSLRSEHQVSGAHSVFDHESSCTAIGTDTLHLRQPLLVQDKCKMPPSCYVLGCMPGSNLGLCLSCLTSQQQTDTLSRRSVLSTHTILLSLDSRGALDTPHLACGAFLYAIFWRDTSALQMGYRTCGQCQSSHVSMHKLHLCF